MKKSFSMLAMALAATLLAGCGQKNKTDYIIAPKAVKRAASSPVRMQEHTQSKEVNWAGSRLVCEIKRTPCDSLPMVKDDTGQKFVDNSITLTIRRGDGSVFLKKTFTKATFHDAIDADYRKTGILEGIVFDRIDGGSLRFAASVCHPQTDEYIPLVVQVAANGSVAISRDTQLDTNGTEEDGDD